jgi:hypothetical protein
MTNWLLRGLVYTAAMVVVRLIQGALINTFPTQAGLISTVLIVLFIAAVILWGLRDGRDDASANPDPDRRADLAMTWLIAGLIAGALSGAITWVIAQVDKALYTGGFLSEISTFAAFTALLVFLGGIGGASLGRLLIDRQLVKVPVRHHGLAAEDDRADTDVFAAVGVGGRDNTAGDAETASTAVASGGHEPPTEEFPTVATGEEPDDDRGPQQS